MTDGAVARHHVTNLLHLYVEAADRKDVDAALALLGTARITFPADASNDPVAARGLFERLWANPDGHRHDVSNLIVHPGGDQHSWSAQAHYTRWVLTPDPILHTLGEYHLVVAEGGAEGQGWGIRALTVTRTWTRTR